MKFRFLLVLAVWAFSFVLPIPLQASATLEPGAPLTEDIVSGLIMHHLPAAADDRRYKIMIDSPKLPLPNHARSPMRIDPTAFDKQHSSGTFNLQLSATLQSGERAAIALFGRVVEEALIPVLIHDIKRHQAITDRDIELQWHQMNASGRHIISDVEDLLGQQAKRPLRKNTPLTQRDLTARIDVKKGETVEVHFSKGSLRLMALGRAMETGSEGQSILISNIDSKKQFRALITGRKEVSVTAGLGDSL